MDCLIPDLKEIFQMIFFTKSQGVVRRSSKQFNFGILISPKTFLFNRNRLYRKYDLGREHPICERIKLKHKSFEKYHCLQTNYRQLCRILDDQDHNIDQVHWKN